MNDDYAELQRIKKNCPPSNVMKGDSYQVMICSNANTYWASAWTPVGNTWGFPYSIKGFAINCAKQWVERLTHQAPSEVYVRVVKTGTGEDVWRSDNVITAWGEVDNA